MSTGKVRPVLWTIRLLDLSKGTNTQITIRSSGLNQDFVGVFNTVNARYWKLDIVQYGTNGRVTIDSANITDEKDIQSTCSCSNL